MSVLFQFIHCSIVCYSHINYIVSMVYVVYCSILPSSVYWSHCDVYIDLQYYALFITSVSLVYWCNVCVVLHYHAVYITSLMNDVYCTALHGMQCVILVTGVPNYCAVYIRSSHCITLVSRW